jgi:hypothetical protein
VKDGDCFEDLDIGGKGNLCGIWEGNVKDGDCFVDLDISGKIILKLIVKEQMRGRELDLANSE